MASPTSLCGICDLRHLSKPAVVWCSDCDEGLCTDCSEHHRLSKASRHHTTTPIDDYQKLPAYIQEIENFCREHNDRFILFCKDHDSPYCRTCSLQRHKSCQNISKIEDVVQNIKTSTIFLETEQILNELAENIEKIIKDREENMVSLENGKIKVEKEIKEFRVKVNNHLDKLQADLVKELHNVEEIERKKIQRLADDLRQKENDIKEMQVNLSNIKQYASDLQAYLSMKQIQNDIGKTESDIDLLGNSENLEQKIISIEINAAMKDILSCVKTFGNTFVEANGSNVVIRKKKNQQAQLMVPQICQHRPIDSITLQLQQTLNVDSSNITGCCMLPDGRLVFTSYDYTNQLIIMNADDTHNTTITIPSGPFDVIYMNFNNSIAVTCGFSFSKSITLINRESNKVQETFKLNSYSYGIAEKNNTLFFCDNATINSLNLTDKSITKCTNTTPGWFSYIAIYENNLYHTNRDTNTVTCYDLSGQFKWEFKEESIIKGPAGICVDNQGNIYVVSIETSNVVVLSSDGKNCRELLSKDKLKQPQAISYNRSTDNLLVPNGKQKAFMYKVS